MEFLANRFQGRGGKEGVPGVDSSCFPITSRETRSPLIEDGLTEVIRLRDEEKKRCDYDDTPETKAMRSILRRWNRFAKDHWLDLLVTDQEFVTVLDRMSEDEREEICERYGQNPTSEILDLSRSSLCRVFNGSFDRGGRFYGGWWQAVPQAHRRFITINGQPTRELDYKGMHLYMLYANLGKECDSDPYTLEGVDPSYRKLIKLTLMKMINAPEGGLYVARLVRVLYGLMGGRVNCAESGPRCPFRLG